MSSDSYFDENPHLVLFSGRVGLVMDASAAGGSILAHVDSTPSSLVSSCADEPPITSKGVYDSLQTTASSIEVKLEMTCGAHSLTAKAKPQNSLGDYGRAEFGLVRQGRAVNHVDVRDLTWIDDHDGNRLNWGHAINPDDPVCTPVERQQQPDTPCSSDSQCTDHRFPFCRGSRPNVVGGCYSVDSNPNPDDATCSTDYDPLGGPCP